MNMFFQLKITLRNLRRGGVYSAIKIGGLAIGMAASIIILLWVYHQWSYDRKEIGIRKVLGASIRDVISLLTKEFLILVTLSLTLALPVAWWIMNKWLSGYAYRTSITVWLFLAVASLTIGIALFTVAFQAIKAAIANPVKAIKTE